MLFPFQTGIRVDDGNGGEELDMINQRMEQLVSLSYSQPFIDKLKMAIELQVQKPFL